MKTSSNTPHESSFSLHLEDWRQILSENVWLIILCIGAFLAAGMYSLLRTVPTYESTMTLEVEQEASNILNIVDVQKQDLQKLETLKTIEQNLRNPALFLRVIKATNLEKDPHVASMGGKKGLSERQLINIFSEMVNVRLRRGTRLIDITVEHPQPAIAEKLARTLIQEYMRQDIEMRSSAVDSAFVFLLEEGERLRNKLEQSENALEAYQASPQRRLDEIKKESAECEAEIAQLSIRYKPRHPKLLGARSKLAQCQAFLTQASVRENGGVELPRISHNVLSREYEADRILYETVLKRMKETQVTKSVKANNVHAVGPAWTSDHPVRPNNLSTLLLCLISGAAVSLGMVITRNMITRPLRNLDQAEQALRLPVVATIPLRRPLASTSPMRDDGHLLVAEAFRSMRVSIHFQNRGQTKQSYLFASALPMEGKSFCAAHYAVALAQQDFRTLLIDLDLRHPVIHEIFQIRRDKGARDYLSEGQSLSDVIATTTTENLSIIPAGKPTADPGRLLGGNRFRQLLKEALLQFDQVVIDTAPILTVSDTLLIAEQIPSIYLVIHAGKTPQSAVMRSLRVLERANAKPLGIILNRLTTSHSSYHYHYSNTQRPDPIEAAIKSSGYAKVAQVPHLSA